jgi:hypothetical protein
MVSAAGADASAARQAQYPCALLQLHGVHDFYRVLSDGTKHNACNRTKHNLDAWLPARQKYIGWCLGLDAAVDNSGLILCELVVSRCCSAAVTAVMVTADVVVPVM